MPSTARRQLSVARGVARACHGEDEAVSVNRLSGICGLLSAYWVSARWREAWLLTGAVFAITTLLSMSSVWVALASADFLAALAGIQTGETGPDPVGVVLMAAGAYLGIFLARTGGWRCAISSPRPCIAERAAGWSVNSTTPFWPMNASRLT